MTRDEAIKYIKSRCIGSAEERDGTQWSDAMCTAIEALSADAVEVVRCKDCKHYQNEHICQYFSRFGTIETPSYGYCCFGERREP